MDLQSASVLSPPIPPSGVEEYRKTAPTVNKVLWSQTMDFQKFLAGAFSRTSPVDEGRGRNVLPLHANALPAGAIPRSVQSGPRPWLEQFRVYKQEQLLAHPGGDSFNLEASDPRADSRYLPGFWKCLGKDIKDALDNAGNLVKDLVWGSKYRYLDGCGHIQSAQRTGLLNHVVDFFKNVVSALSLGYLRTNGDAEPLGIVERVKFSGEKLIDKALLDNLIFGVPSSALNVLDDTALSIWNLMEVVPDAALGNVPQGQRLVTTLFDNGQVVVDYVTDCLPAGDAWMRVHACRMENKDFTPPVLFNLQLPERYAKDSRWSTVRNTPFRKTIETIGSLLADIGVGTATHYVVRTSKGND